MARSIATIKAQILAEKNTQAALSGLNSPSQVAIYTSWIFIQAVTINLFEQILDIYKAYVEDVTSKSFTGSPKWIQDKVFKFQYDATNPQVTQLIDFVPSYPVINPSLRIITRCSVKTNALNQVFVKVAKQDPPVALNGTELASLTGYLSQGGNGTLSGYGTGIGFAGISTTVQSFTSDKLYLNAEIFYDGQYATVIQTTVIAAIDNYLANLPFDGSVKVISLVDAIQSVPGVTDIVITDLAMRPDATPFANKTFLILSKTEILSVYPTFAGYVVSETTTGSTLIDTLTFTAQ